MKAPPDAILAAVHAAIRGNPAIGSEIIVAAAQAMEENRREAKQRARIVADEIDLQLRNLPKPRNERQLMIRKRLEKAHEVAKESAK
jgi:hypothetical protein